MRVLLYLPVVTPWWFENRIMDLIGVLARDAEVHVLVPLLWRGTGICADQIKMCLGLPHVHWHIVDDASHPSLRTSPANQAELLEFVHRLDPQYTICRSADVTSPALFPGKVAFLMEGGCPPLDTPRHWLVLQNTLFDAGSMPPVALHDRQRLLELSAVFEGDPGVEQAENPAGEAALNCDRLILPDAINLALILDYEHEENFFGIHRRFASNLELVRFVYEATGKDTNIIVSDHPLNELHSDCSSLENLLHSMGPRANLLERKDAFAAATNRIIQRADGAILEVSKAFSACAFFGLPTLSYSRTRNRTGFGSYDDIEHFMRDLREGSARGVARSEAMTWFAFHLFNDVFTPLDCDAEEILDRIASPVDPKRWSKGVARYLEHRR